MVCLRLGFITNKSINLSWGDNVMLSNGLDIKPLKSGGASFSGYYSDLHDSVILDKASYYYVV